MGKEISDADLMDVAADPAQARRLRKALRTLADTPDADGRLKEMAREVLSGRLGMREALGSGAYLGAIGDRVAELKRADERLTPEERAAREEQARRWFAQQADQEAGADSADRERGAAARRALRDAPPPLPPTVRARLRFGVRGRAPPTSRPWPRTRLRRRARPGRPGNRWSGRAAARPRPGARRGPRPRRGGSQACPRTARTLPHRVRRRSRAISSSADRAVRAAGSTGSGAGHRVRP